MFLMKINYVRVELILLDLLVVGRGGGGGRTSPPPSLPPSHTLYTGLALYTGRRLATAGEVHACERFNNQIIKGRARKALVARIWGGGRYKGPATHCDAAHLQWGVQKSLPLRGKSLAMLCDVNSNMFNNLLPILEHLSHLLSDLKTVCTIVMGI